jgi:hypothetical protein
MEGAVASVRHLGLLRRLLLVVLPLASLVLPFLVAPAIPADSVVAIQLLRVIFNLLPAVALVVVPVLAYAWSGRGATAAWTTVMAVAVGFVGTVIFMLAVWPSEG